MKYVFLRIVDYIFVITFIQFFLTLHVLHLNLTN